MTSRERVRRILNHQEADRPAIDLGGTSVTGTSGWSYRRLKQALGLPTERVRIFDLFQMLAEVEPEVKDALGCDFDLLPKQRLIMGLDYGKWKPHTFWDGQTFEVPADFNPEMAADGTLNLPWEPGSAQMMRMPAGGRFFDFVPDPEASAIEVPHIPESEWPLQQPLADEWLARERATAEACYESTTRALFAEPPLSAPCGYGSLYGFALKMMTDPEHCRDFMMRAAEATARCYAQYLDAVGDCVEVIAICLADFGLQDREVFAPELFAEFYTPAWRLISDVVHRYPNVKVWIHCCGSVPGMIPHFIDAGVDCLNPVQWTAAGMDLATLKAKYGEDLVFWGGAAATQKTLPFGTTEDVAAEVRGVLDIMAPGGGYVVNAIHNILPEVPVENTVTLYQTAQQYRYK